LRRRSLNAVDSQGGIRSRSAPPRRAQAVASAARSLRPTKECLRASWSRRRAAASGDGHTQAPDAATGSSPRFSNGDESADVCVPGTPGADPNRFVASYFIDWNEAAGLIPLGAGSRYNLLGTPYADSAHADVPECRVDCFGTLLAYHKDLLTGATEGAWGAPVSVDSCQLTGNCCSTATDQSFWVESCVLLRAPKPRSRLASPSGSMAY
jgi:hypothetical protein